MLDWRSSCGSGSCFASLNTFPRKLLNRHVLGWASKQPTSDRHALMPSQTQLIQYHPLANARLTLLNTHPNTGIPIYTSLAASQ